MGLRGLPRCGAAAFVVPYAPLTSSAAAHRTCNIRAAHVPETCMTLVAPRPQSDVVEELRMLSPNLLEAVALELGRRGGSSGRAAEPLDIRPLLLLSPPDTGAAGAADGSKEGGEENAEDWDLEALAAATGLKDKLQVRKNGAAAGGASRRDFLSAQGPTHTGDWVLWLDAVALLRMAVDAGPPTSTAAASAAAAAVPVVTAVALPPLVDIRESSLAARLAATRPVAAPSAAVQTVSAVVQDQQTRPQGWDFPPMPSTAEEVAGAAAAAAAALRLGGGGGSEEPAAASGHSFDARSGGSGGAGIYRTGSGAEASAGRDVRFTSAPAAGPAAPAALAVAVASAAAALAAPESSEELLQRVFPHPSKAPPLWSLLQDAEPAAAGEALEDDGDQPVNGPDSHGGWRQVPHKQQAQQARTSKPMSRSVMLAVAGAYVRRLVAGRLLQVPGHEASARAGCLARLRLLSFVTLHAPP